MGGRIRYTEEFKMGAVAQVTDKGHSVTSVAGRLGVSTKSLYDWVKRYGGEPDMSAGSARPRRSSQKTTGEVRLYQSASG